MRSQVFKIVLIAFAINFLVSRVVQAQVVEGQGTKTQSTSSKNDKRNDKPKDDGNTDWFVDFNLFNHERLALDTKGVLDSILGLGVVEDKPWATLLDLKYPVMPSGGARSKNFKFFVEGNTLKQAESLGRINYGRFTVDTSFWYFVVGFDGTIEKEKIPKLVTFENPSAQIDFFRNAYQATPFLGAKVGDFRKSFVLWKFGQGWAYGEAEEIYRSSAIGNLEPFGWYQSHFLITTMTVEGRWQFYFLAPQLEYKVTTYDPLKIEQSNASPFELRDFQEYVLTSALEVNPLPVTEFFRVVFVYRKEFGSESGLLFANKPPEFRIVMRIIF